MSQPPNQLPPRRGNTRRGELPEPPSVTINRLEHDADHSLGRRPPPHIDYLHAPNASNGCSLWLLGLLGLATIVALFASNLTTMQTIADVLNLRITGISNDTDVPLSDSAPATLDSIDSPAVTAPLTASPTPDPALVLARLQSIGRMTTTQQTYVERLTSVPGTNDPAIQPLAELTRAILQGFGLDATELLRDTITVVLMTDVDAGVDLSQLRDSDLVISTDGTGVQITLPASMIFVAAINSERSNIEQHTTKQRIRPNQTLSGDTHTAAIALTLPQACDAGVMATAAENAKIEVQRLFSFVGFTQVEVIAPVGECRAPASME